MIKIKKLQDWERDLIAVLKGKGLSNKEVGKKLKRDPSTIGREVSRNSWKGRYYVAIHAQARYLNRKSKAGKRHPLKNKEVFKWVIKRLIRGWSPEQISGRMKLVYPNDISMRICPETIYSFIYSDKYSHRKFWEYLPWKHKKRRKKSGRKVHRSRIPGRVSIHERSEVANERSQFGHWEGDSVIGRKGGVGMHTEVERKSRYTKALFIGGVNASDTVAAQIEMFCILPNNAKRSTTLDNGKEFVGHTKLKDIGMNTFFADPYSSWQRGTNEHHNGLIRRYLPKGTDFSGVTQEELDDITEEINTRPRKCLGFYTPKEVFLGELNNQGVAIQPRM